MDTPARPSWLWSQHARLAATVALTTLVIDQAHKFWMLYVYDIVSRGRNHKSPARSAKVSWLADVIHRTVSAIVTLRQQLLRYDFTIRCALYDLLTFCLHH